MAEVLFEFQSVGMSVKVTAVDPQTGLEAVVIVPRGTDGKTMKDLALQKLKYLLAKRRN